MFDPWVVAYFEAQLMYEKRVVRLNFAIQTYSRLKIYKMTPSGISLNTDAFRVLLAAALR